MKWVITTAELVERKLEAVWINNQANYNRQLAREKAAQQANPEALIKELKVEEDFENSNYEIQPPDEDISKSQKFHPWVEYRINRLPRSLQKNYEMFCGGWLHFWDLHVSTELEERKLFFRWSDNRVIIYISMAKPGTAWRVTATITPPSDPPKVPPPPPPGPV